jgi:hypothetical protein
VDRPGPWPDKRRDRGARADHRRANRCSRGRCRTATASASCHHPVLRVIATSAGSPVLPAQSQHELSPTMLPETSQETVCRPVHGALRAQAGIGIFGNDGIPPEHLAAAPRMNRRAIFSRRIAHDRGMCQPSPILTVGRPHRGNCDRDRPRRSKKLTAFNRPKTGNSTPIHRSSSGMPRALLRWRGDGLRHSQGRW